MKWQDDEMEIETDPDSTIKLTTSTIGWLYHVTFWSLVSSVME